MDESTALKSNIPGRAHIVLSVRDDGRLHLQAFRRYTHGASKEVRIGVLVESAARAASDESCGFLLSGTPFMAVQAGGRKARQLLLRRFTGTPTCLDCRRDWRRGGSLLQTEPMEPIMANTLTPVEFHGATLITTIIDGVAYVAIKPICDAIGVDWEAQHARIKRHPVLNSTISVTKIVAEDGKQRDMLLLPLDKLNGWLFGVSVNRVRPELRQKLTQYQAECFDVLARHFGAGKPTVPELAQKAIPPKPSEDQMREALNMGLVMAGYVQQAVAKAVLRGGDDWKQLRWQVSFVTDSKLGTPALVEELPTDAQLTAFAQLREATRIAIVIAQENLDQLDAAQRIKGALQ